MAGLTTTDVYKIALPWALGAMGLGKWLRERALRVPTPHVQDAVDNANGLLQKQFPGSPALSIAQWRAVEQTQAQILNEGIMARATPR